MQKIKFLTLLSTLGLGLAACSSNGNTPRLTPQPNPTNAPATQYTQIERLSRPAIKEVFENFVDHQKSNAIEPYQDTLLQSDIVATEDAVRYGAAGPGAGPDYGKDIAGVVYPDEYLVDLSQTSGAFLGADLHAAAPGTYPASFGGRNLNDDVIGTELGVTFGTLISVLGLDKADNKQNNCLSTQNLPNVGTGQASTTTFPYYPAAR